MKNAQPPEAAENKAEAVKAEAVKVETPKGEPPKAARPEAPTFTAEQLRPDARTLFGISQSTYDGAVSMLEEGAEMTVEAMRAHIEKWLKEEY